MKLSQFSFLILRDNIYLIYNSRTNCFYQANEDVFELINRINDGCCDFSEDETEAISFLKEKKIICDESDDLDYISQLKLYCDIETYSNSHLALTIAPTLQCNLRCPYCFETSKPKGMMDESCCDEIINFIKQHSKIGSVSVNWYGGEPLLNPKAISYLLERLSQLEDIKFNGHSIITNGTLLNANVCEIFSKHPLNSMQITLDGLKENHNKKRFDVHGNGSFDKIISNIERYIQYCPSTQISIRVNIDKSNSGDYIELRKYLADRFGESKNLNIYPAIVRGDSSCNDNIMQIRDQITFFESVAPENVPYELYPRQCSKGCTATNISSYVIGPQGELYLCWEHVGDKKYIIGNIRESRYSNDKLYRTFIQKGTCFTDEKCLKCGMLPICNGGCPNNRIRNIIYHEANSLCSIYSDNNNEALGDLLYNIYKRTV